MKSKGKIRRHVKLPGTRWWGKRFDSGFIPAWSLCSTRRRARTMFELEPEVSIVSAQLIETSELRSLLERLAELEADDGSS